MKKRIIMVLICMAMVLVMMPFSVLAEENVLVDENILSEEDALVEDSALSEETDFISEEVPVLQGDNKNLMEDDTESMEEVIEMEESTEHSGEVVLEADESDFTYTVKNGKVTITGYTGSETDVKIPKIINGYSVTNIGKNAFKANSSLTSIVLPNSLSNIGVGAFSGCTGLKSISIPDKLKSISASAFSGCTGLTRISLPGSITVLGGGVFSGCTGLTSIILPDSITRLGTGTFYGCTGLTSITLPHSLKKIESSVFSGCTSLTSITLPDSITSIDYDAFLNCTGLTRITLPDSVTSIGYRAFFGCTGLKSITFSDNLTKISDYAFFACTNLTSITLPDSLTHIGNYAFLDCKRLTSIILPAKITKIGRYSMGVWREDNWCEIDESDPPDMKYDYYSVPGFLLYCYQDTLAESYAIKNGYHYKLLFKSMSPLETINVIAGSTCELAPDFIFSDATRNGMTWKSSNTGIATVDEDGNVTGVTSGTALITATSKTNNKVKGTCKVRVLFKDATRENVSSGIFTAIYWVADKKITGEKIEFGTMNSMTRGQFVRFLYRYAGNPKVTSTMIKKYGSRFPDVHKSYTHFNAIVWAVSQGLIGGFPDGTFKPNDPLTRGNVATILWKYAGKPSVKINKKPFKDVPKSTSITWGKQKKIIGGYPDGMFMPDNYCLRGDFALFLYRYDKNK